MKILFLCGSLEPGKDGVGDYTRRLANELSQQQHEVGMMAINDSYVAETTHVYLPMVNIAVIRLPSDLSWQEKKDVAHKVVADFNPEVLSLQFVPFAFQQKGLPAGLAGWLLSIGNGNPWHIMFHELWVAMDVAAGYKQRLLGFVQRALIARLINKLKPCLVHTQSSVYVAQLIKMGVKANLLPLFGNIPMVESNLQTHSADVISFVFFGGIHELALADSFASAVSHYSQQKGKPVKIVFAGRNGAYLPQWLAVLEKQKLHIEVRGEMPPEAISLLFQSADAGLNTTPVLLAEKSGSVAAMLEHRLKVLCVAKDWQPRRLRYTPPQLPIIQFEEEFDFNVFFGHKTSNNTFVTLDSVVAQLLNDLKIYHCV
jgi:hypothetical protein